MRLDKRRINYRFGFGAAIALITPKLVYGGCGQKARPDPAPFVWLTSDCGPWADWNGGWWVKARWFLLWGKIFAISL